MTKTISTSETEINALFQLQKTNLLQLANTTAKERIKKIKKIMDWVLANEERINASLYADSKKRPSEVKISEIMPIIAEAKYIMKHLGEWMRPEEVETPLRMMGTVSKIIHEPKGNCLIISPWNYPFNLTLKPLLQAVAAGNAVIIKPSEISVNASHLLSDMINELFDKNEVAVVEGDVEVSTILLGLPFNHIFFTGSPAIGKVVMQAASKYLASVTLELGGKSPTIIDETANIMQAAHAITAEKFLNNGQTCIAPDYVYIHRSKTKAFVEEVGRYLKKMYGEDASKAEDYCRIINRNHFNRVKGLIDEAIGKGAEIAVGGKTKADENYIEPTVVTNVNDDMQIMQHEIFGPVLPVMEFDTHQEVISYINAREKPLALYIFSKKRQNIDYFTLNTSSGSVVVNETSIHYLQDYLPFGGVNNSGIGKSFGRFGFEEFSNKKGVVENKFSAFSLFHPPATNLKLKMLDFIIRWF